MTEQQKDFVQMYLKHRDKIIAHNIVYGDTGNYDAAESAANRLLRIPEIADTIRSIQDNIRYEVEQEFKAKYREELMTIYEKRLLLKKIATGELYVEQKYKGKNCTQCSQYISPTINQMLAALKEDSKLAGHHPFKQNGKWVIPALQTQQEQEEIISTLEKDLSEPCNGAGNKGQHTDSYRENETTIDNQPLTVEQKNTTETTPLLPAPTEGRGFLGGDIGASASGRDKRQSGSPDSYRDREEQETPDENLQQNTTITGQEKATEITLANISPLGGGGELPQDENPPEKDNKIEQMIETTIDNQPLTQELKTHNTPTIISQERLRELLYPLITKIHAYGK